MEIEQGSVMVKGRATIDTRPPFRSVKEAVALFGEKVLVGEIYAKQIKEIQATKMSSEKQNVIPMLGIVSAELEETKKSLQKTREEGNYMANCLKSLREELEETKREIQQLKSTKEVVKKEQSKVINPEIEELNFVKKIRVGHGFDDDYQHEVQKKKFVTFASPPSLTREIVIVQNQNVDNNERSTNKFGRTPSFRREEKNKKQVGNIIGWLLPRKKKEATMND